MFCVFIFILQANSIVGCTAGSTSDTEYVPDFSKDENNGQINQPITENEILTAVRSLKNNKSQA